MPFPDPQPGYRTQYEDRSDAPHGALSGLPVGVPLSIAIGLVAWALVRVILSLF